MAESQLTDQLNVGLKAMVVIACDGAVAAIQNPSRLAAKGIPDAVLAPVHLGRPFDLKGRRGHAVIKVGLTQTAVRR